MPYAPSGLDKVHLFDDISGTTANDFAFKSAFLMHHQIVTGRELTYNNIYEEAKLERPNYKILSFSGSHHGTSIATLSASSHH